MKLDLKKIQNQYMGIVTEVNEYYLNQNLYRDVKINIM